MFILQLLKNPQKIKDKRFLNIIKNLVSALSFSIPGHTTSTSHWVYAAKFNSQGSFYWSANSPHKHI